MTLRSSETQDPQPRRHSCNSCGGSCPFNEPDNWETYEPDPVAVWDDPV